MPGKSSRKILYLMHVDWNWIKQRPHFLAEQLAEEYDILILYALSRSRRNLVSNPSRLRRFPIALLPTLIPVVNELLVFSHKILLFIIFALFRPDTVWITYPKLFDYIPEFMIQRCTVVYDCMDDIHELPASEAFTNDVARAEKMLVKQAAQIFCSSTNLRQKLVMRGVVPDKITVIFNAYDGSILPVAPVTHCNEGMFSVCYIGTISEWMDFDVLLYSLEKMPDLVYHFVGPVFTAAPIHKRMIFHGAVRHDNLYDFVNKFECFILPFKVNQLIESVDPVKLYEYINFNRHIIAVRYAEIERYGDFVNFYTNREELVQVLSVLREQVLPKYSYVQRQHFLELNTWGNRFQLIRQKINILEMDQR